MNTKSNKWRIMSFIVSVVLSISIFNEVAFVPAIVHAGNEDAYHINKLNIENGDVTVKVDDSEVTSAQSGETVTLEPEADYGYEFSSIGAFTYEDEDPTTTIDEIDDIIALMGNNVYYKEGINDSDSSYIKKNYSVDDECDCIYFFYNGEDTDGVQFYQSSSYELNKDNADKGVYEIRYKYGKNRTLLLTIYNNNIICIVIKNIEGYNGAYYREEDKVAVTKTSTGDYTYTQPDKNVNICANFEECGIILDAGEGTIAPGSGGVYSKKRFTISELKNSWNTILKNARRDGYTFSGWYDSDDKEFTYETLSSLELIPETFTLDAKWEKNAYSITIPDFENGTVTTKNNITEAKKGDTVTLTVQPNNGCALKIDSLKVLDGKSKSVELTKIGDNPLQYSFTMPSSDVTVKAVLIVIPTITKAVKSENGDITIKVDGEEIEELTNVQEGKTVTVEIKPDLGYDLEYLGVTKIKTFDDIAAVADLAQLMGNAEFKSFSNGAVSVKTYNEGFAMYFNDQIDLEINSDNVDSFTKSEENKYVAITKVNGLYRYKWSFTVVEEKITVIQIDWIYVQGSNETVNNTLEFKGQSKGSLSGLANIPINTSGTNPTFVMPAGNVTVSASFAVKNYTISYVMKGGKKNTNSPETYTMFSDSFKVPMPTYEGVTYAFDGWTVYNYGEEEPDLSSLDQQKEIASKIMDYTVNKDSTGNLVFEEAYTDLSNAQTTEVQTNVNSDVKGVTTSNFDEVATEEVGETTDPLHVREELKIEKADEEISEDINSEAGTIFKGVDASDVEVKYINMDITKYQTKSDGTRLPDEVVTDFEGVLEIAIPFASLGYETIPKNFGVIREHGTGENKKIDTFEKVSARTTEKEAMKDSTFYADNTDKVLYLYSRFFSTFAIVGTNETTHQVKLDVNGGDELEKSVYNVASEGTLDLPTPTRKNFSFDGWYTLETEGSKVDSTTPITEDMTLYAHWTENEPDPVYYTVSFNSNGGSSVSDQSVLSGNNAVKPDDPTNGNLVFAGWFVNPTLENIINIETLEYNTFDFNTTISENITLKALWSARLTANVSGNGQIAIAEPGEDLEFSDEYPFQSIDQNAIIGLYDSFLIGAKEDEGYKFVKWQKKVAENEFEDYSTDDQITVTVTDFLDLVAVFEETTEIPVYIEHPTLYLKANVTNKSNNRSVVKLSWKKLKDAETYEIYGALANDRDNLQKVTTLKKNKSSYTMNDLEWGKDYVYLVKAVKADGSVLMESLDVYFVTGVTAKSNAKSITAKNIKVRMGETAKIESSANPKESGKTVFGENYTKLYRYFSSDPAIAEVDENGNVTAKAVGKATIYIYAPNGVMKKVTVKVLNPLLLLKASVKEDAKKKTSKVTLSWKAAEGATSYNIYGAQYGEELKKITTVNKKSYTINDLEWDKKYAFVVYAVKADGTEFLKGNNVYVIAGSDTLTNAKQVKASNKTLAVGATDKINPTLVGQDKNKTVVTEFTYFSLQPNIVTVSEDGTVTALTKGKATVYVFAPNGVSKSIRITVK